jgi:hypothetical protein
MMLLIKLMLAHLLGDFVLQPTSWVKHKEKNKLKSYRLYVHGLIHVALIAVLVWDLSFLGWAILLGFLHLVVDGIKLVIQKDDTRRLLFFIDQLSHVVILVAFFCLHEGYTEINRSLFSDENFLLVTLVVFITTPTSFIIPMFISEWASQTGAKPTESLHNAGKYIGILERLFVFTFVVTGNWEAVGFLLAAKSIFRFGDLKKPKQRKLTEYILIGTLLSFGIAVGAGMVYASGVLR